MTIDGLSDDVIRALLATPRTFAVIGASPKPDRPSYGVMRFLIEHGHTVHPVNPAAAGSQIHGRLVYAALADVPAPVDIVDIFRASEAAAGPVAEAIALKDRLGIGTVWMQLGVINEGAAAQARASGLTAVMDRCPVIEVRRLRL